MPGPADYSPYLEKPKGAASFDRSDRSPTSHYEVSTETWTTCQRHPCGGLRMPHMMYQLMGCSGKQTDHAYTHACSQCDTASTFRYYDSTQLLPWKLLNISYVTACGMHKDMCLLGALNLQDSGQ